MGNLKEERQVKILSWLLYFSPVLYAILPQEKNFIYFLYEKYWGTISGITGKLLQGYNIYSKTEQAKAILFKILAEVIRICGYIINLFANIYFDLVKQFSEKEIRLTIAIIMILIIKMLLTFVLALFWKDEILHHKKTCYPLLSILYFPISVPAMLIILVLEGIIFVLEKIKSQIKPVKLGPKYNGKISLNKSNKRNYGNEWNIRTMPVSKPSKTVDTTESSNINGAYIGTPILAKISNTENDDPWLKLENMIGLKAVKEKVKEILMFARYQREVHKFREVQEQSLHQSLHMIFTGNPGTGKTEVARIIGEIFSNEGILQNGHIVEVSRSDLVGEYIGHTEKKVKEAIKKAIGGILFIDEAYSLATQKTDSKDYGNQAINVLLKEMEDNRDKLIVIAAGYRDEMIDFLNSNPGLKSRFAIVIDFPDYTVEELEQIYIKMCKDNGYTLTDEAKNVLRAKLNIQGRTKSFSNARGVRNLYEETIRNVAKRVIKDKSIEYFTILPEDIPNNETQDIQIDEIMSEINKLIGLNELKRQIIDLILLRKYEYGKILNGEKVELISLHLALVGNPGTGKTTVARLLGKAYQQIGLLTKGHVVEVSRADLVGSYIGKTEEKTAAIIEKAEGGILFIDEAYSLFTNDTKDFGQRAIDVLIKRMEDNRGNFMVIFAGYPEEMDKLFNSNPGFRSRISSFIKFPDYTDQELIEILKAMCKNNNDIIDEAAYQKVKELLPGLKAVRGRYFGNAREIRNIYEKAKVKRAVRVEKGEGVDVILAIDIPDISELL